MGSYHSIRNPPKYYCNACGRGFRRRKQHNDHVLYNRCRVMKKQDKERTKKSRTKQQEDIILDTEVQPLERIQDQSYSTPDNPYAQHYYGAPYDYPGLTFPRETQKLATGNRHLRCGLPFATDPLRRTIVRPTLPKALPSLGQAPTLSKHKYGAQAI